MSLSNNKIVRIWEIANMQHPVDRAISILLEAFPDKSWEELVRLSLGERNEFLLSARENIFGSRFEGSGICEHCKKGLDFIADADELRIESDIDRRDVYKMELDECEIEFRSLNSIDLAAVASYKNTKELRKMLAKRSILKMRGDNDISYDNLGDGLIDALSENLSRIDPMAVMKIDLACPECGGDLSLSLDIVSFFWKEIDAQAKRLMREVNVLARYYGWSEADILSMSAARRYYYMEMAEA